MKLEIGQTIRIKVIRGLGHGREFDAVVDDIDQSEPKPVYIGGRRIGTPLHPKGTLYFLKEIKPDGSLSVAACYHQREFRVADKFGGWWAV